MTIQLLIDLLDAKVINLIDANLKIENYYCGDLLSHVIGKSPTACAWFTVINNINVCAVAKLKSMSVVVLCDDITPDDNLLKKIKEQNVNLIVTKYDVYNSINILAKHISD